MKRLGRLRSLVYLVLSVLVLLGGTRLVLSSGFVANKVADRLSSLLGVPVRVSGVDIALGGRSSVQGLQIFEADGLRPETPWATAADVRPDFSAVDMFGDDMPKDVVLVGASVELLFGEDGTLLTRLPKSTGDTRGMPKLLLENARLTIKQVKREHRPLVVSGVTAEFSYADGAFRFEGTCADAFWGRWTVRGSYDVAADVFRLVLHTDRTEVTAEKLTLLPFVPDGVWEAVKIAGGVTPVDLDLTTRSDAPVKYRIALKPEDTRLYVSSIDLDAEQASGEVVIEDFVVRLAGVKGRTAGGTIGTEAELDFRGDNARLDFKTVWVDAVELQRLPDSWKLKHYKITGKLTGKANLDVCVKPEGVETTGGGQGVVNEGIFRSLPLVVPIKINLTADTDAIRILPAFPGL